MDSYYGTLQWYQSRRSSAAHRKIEKEIEIETENCPSHHYNQPQRISGIYGTYLKEFSNQTGGTKEEKSMENLCEPLNIHESIDQKMTEIRRMIADMKSKQSNHSDFSSKSVPNQQSISDLESQQLFGTKSVQNYQVSLQSGNSNSYKKYNIYSAMELDNRRDRGLCLWCDELFYEGHDCCKEKKLYVFELDEKLVEKDVFHCDEHLVEDCVENDSNALRNITCADGIENRESSEAVCKKYTVENHELKVFEKWLEKDALEIFDDIFVTHIFVTHPTDVESNRLWTLDATVGCLVVFTAPKDVCLDDASSGKWMSILIVNQSSKGVDSLHKLYGMLEDQTRVVEWPELPLPPPEPPPRML